MITHSDEVSRYIASLAQMTPRELIGHHANIARQTGAPLGSDAREAAQSMMPLIRDEMLRRMEAN